MELIDRIQRDFGHLEFTHFVSVPTSGYFMATAKNRYTGRTKIFLIVNDSQIYVRNGLAESWQELNSLQRDAIRQSVKNALSQDIPCYSSSSSDLGISR